MSHFAVAVIHRENQEIDKLLEPYMENCCDTPDYKYMKFYDGIEEHGNEYENDSVERVKMPDGRLLAPWDEEFRVPGEFGYGSKTHKVPDELERVQVPLKELYPTVEAFLRDWYGQDIDERTGRFGYWQNPNAKWDWYDGGGGRFRKYAEELMGFQSGPVAAIRFDSEAHREDAEKWWDENMDDDGKPKNVFAAFEYDGMAREQYVESRAHLSYRAVVTPDGTWHEPGEMGWWGISSEPADEKYDWDIHFEERFIEPYKDCIITVVDCHI